MQDKITSLITDDRVDEVYHNETSPEKVHQVIEYILMEHKKTNMTSNVSLYSPEGAVINPTQAHEYRHLFVILQGIKNSRNLTNPREIRYTYNIQEKVAIEKYRNNRKTEQTQYSFEQLKSFIQAFQSSTGAFLQQTAKLQSNQFVAPLLPPEQVAQRTKVKVKGGQMAYVQLERKNRPPFRNYTADEVSKHNKPGDAWTVLNGKIYDISLYCDYHPGGDDKLMLGAGRDCSKLFNQFHPWVNGHAFLEKDYIGNLKS